MKQFHPEAFEEAKKYEKNAVEHGSPFTWSNGESLDEMELPERVAEIRADHERRLMRAKARAHKNPLRATDLTDIDDLYGQAKVCLACHK